MISNVFFTSNSDEWATPAEIFKMLDDEFSFNLDPCANSQNHKCDTFYTVENDGLSHSWGGV
jgi:phage N-6-adenine-methyltransferase